LAHPEDFVIRAELLAGLDRLNLGSTRMSNGSQRNRLILRLFLGGLRARPRKRKSLARPDPKIRPVAWPDHRQPYPWSRLWTVRNSETPLTALACKVWTPITVPIPETVPTVPSDRRDTQERRPEGSIHSGQVQADRFGIVPPM